MCARHARPRVTHDLLPTANTWRRSHQGPAILSRFIQYPCALFQTRPTFCPRTPGVKLVAASPITWCDLGKSYYKGKVNYKGDPNRYKGKVVYVRADRCKFSVLASMAHLTGARALVIGGLSVPPPRCHVGRVTGGTVPTPWSLGCWKWVAPRLCLLAAGDNAGEIPFISAFSNHYLELSEFDVPCTLLPCLRGRPCSRTPMPRRQPPHLSLHLSPSLLFGP